jgi:hypothetical protein
MPLPLDKDDAWETFFCTSCGWRCTRLKGSFDFPICAECRMWDELDPSGKLKHERMSKLQ